MQMLPMPATNSVILLEDSLDQENERNDIPIENVARYLERNSTNETILIHFM